MERRLLIVYVALLLRCVSLGVFLLVIPLFVRSLGFSVVEWGVMNACFSVGLMSELVWGELSDRIEKTRLMYYSSFLSSFVVFLFTLESLVPYFFLLQFLSGVFGVVMGIVSRVLISDLVSSRNLGTSMGLWWAFFLLGGMLGSIIGSYVTEFWSFIPSLYISSIILIANGLLIILGFRKHCGHESYRKEEHCSGNIEGKSFIQKAKKLFTIRSAVIVFPMTTVFMMARPMSFFAFLSMFAAEQLGATVLEIGLIFAVWYGVSVVASPIFGRLSDKMGTKPVIVAGFFLLSSATLGYVFTNTVYQALLTTAFSAVNSSLLAPALLATLADTVSGDIRGIAIGFYGCFEDLGVLIGSLLYGVVWSLYGSRSIFYVCATAQTLGLLLSLLIPPKATK